MSRTGRRPSAPRGGTACYTTAPVIRSNQIEGPPIMKILVTGGAGFIASHIVDAYIEAGHEVLVVENLWSEGGGRRENINPKARFYEMDIRSPAAARLIMAEKPEVVNLHAAQHSVKISTDQPVLDAEV